MVFGHGFQSWHKDLRGDEKGNPMIRIVKQNRITGDLRTATYFEHWKANDRMAARYRRTLNAMFDEQKKIIIGRLPLLKGVKFLAVGDEILEKTIGDVLRNFKPEQTRVFVGVEKPFLLQTLKQTARQIFALTGDDIDVFDLQKRRITNYLERQSLTASKSVTDTTVDDVRRQLSEGVKNNESIPEIQNRIEKYFDESAKFRAEAIARTEIGNAAGFGQQEAYMQSEVVEKKEWVATLDDRVRDDHADADGQIVSKNQPFDVGGDDMMFPRDGSRGASVDQIVNCRCTTVPVL